MLNTRADKGLLVEQRGCVRFLLCVKCKFGEDETGYALQRYEGEFNAAGETALQPAVGNKYCELLLVLLECPLDSNTARPVHPISH